MKFQPNGIYTSSSIQHFFLLFFFFSKIRSILRNIRKDNFVIESAVRIGTIFNRLMLIFTQNWHIFVTNKFLGVFQQSCNERNWLDHHRTSYVWIYYVFLGCSTVVVNDVKYLKKMAKTTVSLVYFAFHSNELFARNLIKWNDKTYIKWFASQNMSFIDILAYSLVEYVTQNGGAQRNCVIVVSIVFSLWYCLGRLESYETESCKGRGL